MQSAADRNQYATNFPPSELQTLFKAPNTSIERRVAQYISPTSGVPTINAESASSPVRFVIPKTGAIDTKSFRLWVKFGITVTTTGTLTANDKVRLDSAGLSSMISGINVYLGSGLVEQVNRASQLSGMLISLCPEDYRDGGLSVFEKTQFNDSVVGGLELISATAAAGVATTVYLAGSINLPIGLLNTNSAFFSELYEPLSIELTFNSWKNFLVINTNTSSFISNTLSVNLVESQLRFDRLDLSRDFMTMMYKEIQANQSYEYPYMSYRTMNNSLSSSTAQNVKVSGVSGASLQSIIFGFTSVGQNDTANSTNTSWVNGGLTSYAFSVGGIQIPSRVIDTTLGVLPVVATTGGSSNVLDSDAMVELFRCRNSFKSYDIGIQSVNETCTTTGGTVPRRLYGYSFVQSYDEETKSGLVLMNGEEITVEMTFSADPSAYAMYIALCYEQTVVMDANGSAFNQL